MADGKGHRLLAALRIIAASARVARLGNLGRDWLPPTGVLAGLVVGLVAIDVLRLALGRSLPQGARSWGLALRRHGFLVALGALTALALVLRLPAIGADLGHTFAWRPPAPLGRCGSHGFASARSYSGSPAATRRYFARSSPERTRKS